MTQEVKVTVGIAIASILILLGGVFFLSDTNGATPEPSSVDSIVLTRNANHKISSDNARVTIVEFADFQCPACANTHPVIKQLLEDYKGKITFIYRHFPLPQHKNAILAAKAAEAAGEQGKFWEMYDILYQQQSEWSESLDSTSIFSRYAKELGLNITKFNQDLKNVIYDQRIQNDKNDGITLGVNSTPTLFINNKKVITTPTYTNLKQLIESEFE